jgi:magnesium transporter
VPTARRDEPVGVVLDRILGADRYDSVAEIAVLEADRLVGLVQVEDLMAASSETHLDSLMHPDPPVIASDVDREQAAVTAAALDRSSVAVVDSAGRFVGLMPTYRMLAVVLDEHAEDLARLSGYLHDADQARLTSREGLGMRVWHRAPWLLVGLAAAMAAAAIVAQYEQSLASNLALAFFIPSIVYIADAVGTQTETLVVRGLSLGVSIANVARKEILTGLALGVALSAIALPAVAVWQGLPVGIVVSASILLASTVASGVAMTLPWVFSKLGTDPAFGSGPLATVVQDLLSLVIYFGIATLVL